MLTDQTPDFLNLTEAARILRFDPRTVRRLILEGKLPAGRSRRAWRIPYAAVVDFAWHFENMEQTDDTLLQNRKFLAS